MKPTTARRLLRVSGLPSLGGLGPAVDAVPTSTLESAADRLLPFTILRAGARARFSDR